ncbi:MAG: preprotein translocase subunit YajC [Muribaculaceae bacterium]|nr:preprotein translocase subunit YajC [Muribaculaceae bacterium]MDE5714391.1 preprotein translocase subunit YajC [Muribaculaceae bacterium]
MNLLNSIFLLEAQPQGGGISGIIMIVAMIAIFYFFMIRPQSKKQKEIKKAREAMQVGDKVITAGGIHGKIKDINETTITVEVAQGVSLKVDKTSVYPAAEKPAEKK